MGQMESHLLSPGPCTTHMCCRNFSTTWKSSSWRPAKQLSLKGSTGNPWSIQGLPDRTSSAATYLLLSALPVEAMLHAWILQLVGKIIMGRDTFLHYIAPGPGSSWPSKLAAKYILPLPHELLTCSISQGWWHTMVNTAIKDYRELSMLRDATSKSTSPCSSSRPLLLAIPTQSGRISNARWKTLHVLE